MDEQPLNELQSRLRRLANDYRLTLPDIGAEYEFYDLSVEHDARHVAEVFNIHASCGDRPNLLVIHRSARRLASPTQLSMAAAHNIVVIGENCGFRGSLDFEGDDNLVVLAGGQNVLAIEAHLLKGDTLACGQAAFAWGIRVWVQGGTVCAIGDDCLLSENITIRTTDHHSVVDLETWRQINFPADVVIGRHVWIGAFTNIAKGVRIGDGAIIAQGTALTKSVPRMEMWGGTPAQMLRRKVSWVQSHPATLAELSRLRILLDEPEDTG